MKKIAIIAHNLRSTHNVGSLLRTADGLGIDELYLTGYTPYPLKEGDSRLPHLARKIDRQIAKTALGAEKSVNWSQSPKIESIIELIKTQGYRVFALEQTKTATALNKFQSPQKIAIIVGREVEGLEAEVISLCDGALQIPMLGKKESLNVTIAAAIALYVLRYN